MSKIAPFAAAVSAVLLAASIGPVALAKAKAVTPDPDSTNLFISPPGEPFTAPGLDPYPIVKWFKRADTNNDGKLDIDEFRADADSFFRVLDRNGDGVISSAEVTYYEQHIVPEILQAASLDSGVIRVLMPTAPGQVDPDGDQIGGALQLPQRLDTDQGAVPYSLFHEPEPVRSADRNFDYVITLQEFRDQSDRHFHALDKTGKGFLVLADLPRTESETRTGSHR